MSGPAATLAGRWAGSRLRQWDEWALGDYVARKMNEAYEKAYPQEKEKKKSNQKQRRTIAKETAVTKIRANISRKAKAKVNTVGAPTVTPTRREPVRQDAYKGSALDPQSGPAIQMDPGDHRQTQSYGSSEEAIEYRSKQRDLIRQGKSKEALQMDIDDVKEIAKNSGDPKKYDQALKEMEEYYKCLEEHGIEPKFDAVS